MPTPKKGETQKAFIDRCVPIVLKEKDTKSKAHAVAKCGGIWKQHSDSRDVSLSDRQTLVHTTWTATYGSEKGPLPYTYPRYIFDDYVVIHVSGKYVRVGYSMGDLGVEFDEPDTWSEVEMEFVARRDIQVPIRKVVDDDGTTKYKCYGVLFGSPDNRDVYNTYFDVDTKYHLDWYDRRPWLYDHGTHPMVRTEKVGVWNEAGIDEQGVFLLGELDKRFKYLEAIETLIDNELVFPSQGTLGYCMSVAEDGHIEDWPLVEVSSTVSPANLQQRAITPEVARAYRTLTGGIMGKQKGVPLPAWLGGRRDVEEPEVEEVEEAEEVEEVEEVEEGTIDWDEAARAMQIPTIVEAVRAVDTRLQETAQRLEDLEGIVSNLAEKELARTKRALEDGDWVNQLYSFTQTEEPAEDPKPTRTSTGSPALDIAKQQGS